MDYRQLQAFIAIAEHGSVVAAGRALHQSPSSVSRALASLEADLGVRLFKRHARGMVVTDAGHAVLRPARRALSQLESMRAAVDALEGLVGGQVSIVCLHMMASWIADLMGAFHVEFPHVSFKILGPVGDDFEVADLVRSGECDLGVLRLSYLPGDLEGVAVGRETGVLLVPEGHRLDTQPSVEIDELRDERFIVPTNRFRPQFDELFREAGFAPKVVVETDHADTALELVRAGMGVTLGRAESVDPVLGRGAVMVPIAPAVASTLVISARRNDPLSPAAEAFRGFVARRHIDATESTI
jgi:DNA-binding transcriptional LysR family regulator